MNDKEFKAWARKMAAEAGFWVRDAVTANNRPGCDLFYVATPSDPTRGIFVSIENGALQTGRFEGAIPHIGEAMFVAKHTANFSSHADALTHCIERLGLSFLLAATQGASPYRSA